MSPESPPTPDMPAFANSLRLLSVKELAAIFRVGEPAIRKRIRLRQLGPVLRQGRGYVMRASALERYFARGEAEWADDG